MTLLLEDIRNLLGPGGLLSAEEAAERPANIKLQAIPRTAIGIARPRTTEEVAAVLRLCHAAGQPICVQGGVTCLDGSISAPGELALSLERMTAIEEIDAVARIATVQAGCILQTLQQAVQDHDLYYGVDYGGRGSATIGGNISTNAGGMNVLRYGMTRDQVLGLEAVLADGTVISSMNRMLKNNAGYDLKQLFIGTEGTLGIVTRAIVRLRPRPRSEHAALVALDSFPDLLAFLGFCQERFAEALTSFEVMWQAHYDHVVDHSGKRPPLAKGRPFYANVEVRGVDPEGDAVHFEQVMAAALERGLLSDAVLPKSLAEVEAAWAPRENMEWAHRRWLDWVMGDISLPLREMETYVADLSAAMRARWPDSELYVFGHIADGNLHVFAAPGGRDPADMAECSALMYRPLKAFAGSIAAEHGIGRHKTKDLHYSRTPAEIDLMRLLKRTLDPKCILNPGRVVVV